MKNKQNGSPHFTPRENFLMSLLNKIVNEYKTLHAQTRKCKPLKIVEIISLSQIPGETKFTIQVTNKNVLISLSAAEIINANYNLNEFNHFHAEIIRKAAQGKLVEFLKLTESKPEYNIVSKRFDANLQQHIFTLESASGFRHNKTVGELFTDKKLLSNIGMEDVYDIAYTHGTESILKEKVNLSLAKQK